MSRPTNIDMLAWFDNDERERCGACGQSACVRVAAAETLFCFACGAVWLDGVRLDTEGELRTE